MNRERSFTTRMSAGMIAAAAFILIAIVLHPIWKNAAPLDEEWAITAASRFSLWTTWFTRGYADYLLPYSEWPPYGTYRLRPLVNLLYACVQDIGGDQQTLVLINYASHVLCLLMVWRLLKRCTGLNRPGRIAALCAAALSPALLQIPTGYRIAPPLQYPIYGAEMGCALLCLLALEGLIDGALWRYCVFATAALFTKETALTLPIAGLLCTGCWWQPGEGRRNGARALVIVAPIALWLWIRIAVFEPTGVDGSLGSIHGIADLLTRIAKAALIWPTDFFRDYPGSLLTAWRSRETATTLIGAVSIAANLLFWILLAATLWRRLRPAFGMHRQHWPQISADPAFLLLVAAAGNQVLVMILGGLELRYGYLWTLLGPGALMALTPQRGRLQRLMMLLVCAGISGLGVRDLRANLAPPAVQARADMLDAASQLAELARHPPPGTSQLILAEDWTIESSSNRYFTEQVGTGVPLTRLTDVMIDDRDDCTPDQARLGQTRLRRNGDQVEVEMTPPPCFAFMFHGFMNGQIPLPPDAGADTEVARGPLRYRFPDLRREQSGALARKPIFDLGARRIVHLPYDPDALWITFDYTSRRYRALPARLIGMESSAEESQAN